METFNEKNKITVKEFLKKNVLIQNLNKESVQIGFFRMCISLFNNVENQKHDLKTDDLNLLSQLTELLLQNLIKNDSLDTDSRLLCATSLFYVFLTEISHDNTSTEKFDRIMDTLSFEDFESFDNHEKKINLCLIYGLCQSNFLKCVSLHKEAIRAIDCGMKFLGKLCMAYSEFSQMAFKMLHLLLESIIQSNLECTLNLNKLLYITITNWESPITGVREYNSKIFGITVKLITNDIYNKLLEDLHHMEWNKAKFLMLVELLDYKGFSGLKDNFKMGDHFTESLINSLRVSGLVTAGADAYRTLLKSLKTIEQWNTMFLKKLTHFVKIENMYSLRNFCNHWLPGTIKQYGDVFLEIFYQLNEASESRVNVLYVCVVILKWRKKLGYIDELDATEMSILKESLMHSSDNLRKEAIQALCVWHKISTPTLKEFICVREFITYNLNSDCTPLRQSLLSGLTIFLVRVRNSYFQKVEQDNKVEYADDLENLRDFFRWLSTYLLENLDEGGNYQRKVTSLSIIEAMLYCFTEGATEKNQSKLISKSCGKNQGSKVLEYIDNQCCWNLTSKMTVNAIICSLYSPSIDIREKSSQILLTFYFRNPFFLNVIDDLYSTGKKLCCSQYFYESDCGQTLILLVYRVFLKIHPDSLDMAYNIATDIYSMCLEYQKNQEQDMLLAITNSNNYHSLLSALVVIMLSNQSENADPAFLCDLHSFVESKVVKHNLRLFARNAETTKGPASFAEIGECVDDIVKSCSSVPVGNRSEMHELLTDAHQVVLNCIWHNIKAGCDVCSAIISTVNRHDLANELLIKQCLDTLISVLRNCLHKGVIESACSALGRSIDDLTSSANGHLARDALDKFLREELTPSERDRNVTRRSAGLALCVRAFVINDNNKSKVLFHSVMEYLIDNLEQNRLDLKRVSETAGCYNKDSRLATLLHLSCATVRDSSLTVHVMQYATKLLSLCFYFLKSDHWQIRNGALQLFGTLAPKLKGQRKTQDNDSVSMSPEELFSHFTKLWIIITETLSNAADGKDYLQHSDLVPVLSFLSSLAKKYTLDSVLSSFNGVSYESVFIPLTALLASPNYTVRKLSAVIIVKFFDADCVDNYILRCDSTALKENELHGVLLLLKQHLNQNVRFKATLTTPDYKDFLKNVYSQDRSCVVQTTCLEIENLLQLNISKIYNRQNAILLNDKIRLQPYGYVLIEMKLAQMICDDTAGSFVDFLPSYLLYINKVIIINILEKRILRDDLEFNQIIKCIHIIFEYIEDVDFKDLYRTLLRIIDAHDEDKIDHALRSYDYLSRLFIKLEKNMSCDSFYNDGLLLPLCMRLLNGNKSFLLKNVPYQILTSHLLWSLCQADKYDSDKRIVAVTTLKYSLSWITIFDKMCQGFRINLLKSVVWLLQDEDVAVRKDTARLFSKFVGDQSLNPTICLDNILSYTLLSKLFHHNKEHIVNFLQDTRNDLSKEISGENKDIIKNPFGNESSNVYWEPAILKIRIETLLCDQGLLE